MRAASKIHRETGLPSHSSRLVQKVPLPVKPAVQVQSNDPSLWIGEKDSLGQGTLMLIHMHNSSVSDHQEGKTESWSTHVLEQLARLEQS